MSELVKERVTPHLQNMHSYMWDECHKIYISFSKGISERLAKIGYEVIVVDDENRNQVVSVISTWWKESCALKFINGVAEGPDGEERFFNIISQMEEDPEDDYDYDDDYDEDDDGSW